MKIDVLRAFHLVGNALLLDDAIPKHWKTAVGDYIGTLTNLREHPSPGGPLWTVEVRLRERPHAESICVPIERFLSTREWELAQQTPVALQDLDMANDLKDAIGSGRSLWFYRDGIFLTNREPQEAEIEVVSLRIKARVLAEADDLRRLRAQVANLEAAEVGRPNENVRRPLPDDVRLAVWARDGGRCVRCGAGERLQFDHIIPLSRGGGDHAENIQILCQPCNLAKSDRIA